MYEGGYTKSLKRNGSVPTTPKISEDVDRNHTMTYRKMDTVKSVTDMCDGGALIKRVIVVQWKHTGRMRTWGGGSKPPNDI